MEALDDNFLLEESSSLFCYILWLGIGIIFYQIFKFYGVIALFVNDFFGRKLHVICHLPKNSLFSKFLNSDLLESNTRAVFEATSYFAVLLP